MSFSFNDSGTEISHPEYKLPTDESLLAIPSVLLPETLTTKLSQQLFTHIESHLREHSELIAKDLTLRQLYIDTVLASRNRHDDLERDHTVTVAAANAISVLNYGSRSGIFPFRFIDIRDWSGIRIPNANLNYAMMAHCNLENADLSGSSIVNITLINANLRQTNLSNVRSHEVAVLRTDNLKGLVAIHPRDTFVVSEDTTRKALRVFNFETNEDVCHLNGKTSDIESLTFSHDGKYLASLGDASIRIWDMSSYKRKSVLRLPPSCACFDVCLVFSPDNSRIMVSCDRSTIHIGNVETSEWITAFHHEGVTDIDWSYSEDRVLSYSNHHDVCIWDVKTTPTCTARWQVESESSSLYTVKFTLDGTRIVINVLYDIYIFDVATATCIAKLPKDRSSQLMFAQDARYLYVPSGRWISVVDLETFECIRRLPESSLYDLSLIADRQRLTIYNPSDCTFKIYDTVAVTSCAPLVVRDRPNYYAFAFSPDNRHLVATCSAPDGYLKFFDVSAGNCIETASGFTRNESYYLSYSPDGRWIAFVRHLASRIDVYDVNNRKLITCLTKHATCVMCIVFNSKASLLASSAMDCDYDDDDDDDDGGGGSDGGGSDGGGDGDPRNGDILLWDTKTWTSRRLRGHTSEVRQMCFSPDGNTLASVSRDRTIRLWNVITDKCIMQIGDGSAPIYAAFVSYSLCGRFLATANQSRSIQIWNVTNGKLINSFREPPHDYMCGEVAFLRNGMLMSLNGIYRIYDIFTGECVDLGMKAADTRVYLSFDRHFMASRVAMDSDTAVYLWQFPEDSWKMTVLLDNADIVRTPRAVQAMKISSCTKDTFSVAYASEQDGSIYICTSSKDVMTSSNGVLQGHTDLVTCTCTSFDGGYLVSGSRDNTIRIWNLETQRCTAVLEGHVGPMNCVQVSPDDQIVASGSDDMTIRLWSISEGKCIGEFESHTTPIKQLKFSPDGKSIASTGTGSHVISIWDTQAGSCSNTLEHHTDEIFDIQFSSDGAYLASGSFDDTIRVWEIKTAECIATLKGHSDCLTCFAFSSDGHTVVSGSEDNTIRVWSVLTGECSLVISEHTGHIRSLCLTPDNRCIISASNDRVIHIWDMATGAMLHQLLGHTDQVISVRLINYDVDGDSSIISTSSDGTIRLWTVTKMPLRVPYLPEMRSISGAQVTMELTGADFTDAIMDSSFSQRIDCARS